MRLTTPNDLRSTYVLTGANIFKPAIPARDGSLGDELAFAEWPEDLQRIARGALLGHTCGDAKDLLDEVESAARSEGYEMGEPAGRSTLNAEWCEWLTRNLKVVHEAIDKGGPPAPAWRAFEALCRSVVKGGGL